MSPASAVSSHNEMAEVSTCVGPGCGDTVAQAGRGRPARFCSPACRARAYRQRRAQAAPVTVEVDYGSASSRGRLPGEAWMVRLRRADQSVIVAIGLRRSAADRLKAAITELLDPGQNGAAAR